MARTEIQIKEILFNTLRVIQKKCNNTKSEECSDCKWFNHEEEVCDFVERGMGFPFDWELGKEAENEAL